MVGSRLRKPWRVIHALIGISAVSCPLVAGPINSDVAFTPREGGGVLRLQYTYEEAGAGGAVRHKNQSTVRGVLVYGLRQNLALILSAPYVNRQVDRFDKRFGRTEEAHDGVGDITLLLKYRFYQKDLGPMSTVRLAALGGLNVRSGDMEFSSDSYDPIVGAVFTWRHDRNKFDADLIYQFNTAGGQAGHDTLRYDLAYSRRIYPATYDDSTGYEILAVAELNGRYKTDGSHTIYLAPGVVLLSEQWSLEMSIQLPALQNLAGDGPETRYRLVTGLRYRW